MGYCVIFILIGILLLLMCMLTKWIDRNRDNELSIKRNVIVELKIKPDEEMAKTVENQTE